MLFSLPFEWYPNFLTWFSVMLGPLQDFNPVLHLAGNISRLKHAFYPHTEIDR